MSRREKLKPFTLYTEVLDLIENGILDFKDTINEDKAKAHVTLIVEMALEEGLKSRISFLSKEDSKNIFSEKYQKLLTKGTQRE